MVNFNYKSTVHGPRSTEYPLFLLSVARVFGIRSSVFLPSSVVRRLSTVVLIISILCANACLAKDVDFEASVDKSRISIDESIVLSLTFHGTQSIPAPDLSVIDSFHVQYVGPSTMMSIVNGRMSASITHKYLLIPHEEGRFQIGPFSFEYRGDTYSAPLTTIEVFKGPVSRGSYPGRPQPEELRLDDRIFMVMEAKKTTAYMNEEIPLTIKLYINRLSVRDIQYPKFDHEGFSIEPFIPARQYQETLGGAMYDVIEFNTTIFATRTGVLVLGPAETKCNVIKKESRSRSVFDEMFGRDDMMDDFFGRYSKIPYETKSRPLPMTILPFPEEGKPRDFSGAVGDFEFTVLADPAEVKVGDPITLKMNVAGRGNLKSVDMPALDVGDDFKVYDPEVTQDETGKTSKQAIIPKDDDVSEIPKMSFSFFNPALEKYETITKGPIPITVKPLAKGEGLKVFEPRPEGPRDVTRKKEILGRDIIYIKDNPGNLAPKGEFLYKNKLFIIFQFIPALLVVSVLIVQRKRERLQKDIRYARKLRAPGKAKKNLHMTHRLLNPKEPDKFYDAVFKTLQEYIGDTFHLPTAGITSNVVGELKVRNIDEGILAKVGECFENCDTARYAHTDITREQMLATYKLLEEVIDRLERVRI